MKQSLSFCGLKSRFSFCFPFALTVFPADDEAFRRWIGRFPPSMRTKFSFCSPLSVLLVCWGTLILDRIEADTCQCFFELLQGQVSVRLAVTVSISDCCKPGKLTLTSDDRELLSSVTAVTYKHTFKRVYTVIWLFQSSFVWLSKYSSYKCFLFFFKHMLIIKIIKKNTLSMVVFLLPTIFPFCFFSFYQRLWRECVTDSILRLSPLHS